MLAILTGGPGSWETATCPTVEVPEALAHLVHEYQGETVLTGSEVKAAGWTWVGADFAGVPVSKFVLCPVAEAEMYSEPVWKGMTVGIEADGYRHT